VRDGLSEVSLSPEAKALLPVLERQAAPPLPDFWWLTQRGIIRGTLMPGLRSPAGLGFKRTPRFRIYSPETGKPLQRVRLWVSGEVTEQQADEWIKPYKAPPPLQLFEVHPTTYNLARPRKFDFEYIVNPDLNNRLEEVVGEMNKLPYVGVWRILKLKETGERVVMVERGVRPTVVLKPETGTFWGLQEEDFDVEQVNQTSAIILMMLASHFPRLLRYTRRSKHLTDEEMDRLTEVKEE